MVRHAQEVEPEHGETREHAALVGDAGRQHPVEGTDAVRGDEDEAVAEVVDVADLAPTAWVAGDVALQQR
jgi:hypothetical protein